MQLDDFNYDLPEHLIARYPLTQRSASRLLVLPRSQPLQHRSFTDLLTLLQPGDLLVFNDSRVIQARLPGQKQTGGKIEILVERIVSPQRIEALIKASKAPKIGSDVLLAGVVPAQVVQREDDIFTLSLSGTLSALEVIEQYGSIPLPPYFKRDQEALDEERYQTVYAREKGSVAAPTAGLHFDWPLLEQLQQRAIDFAYVTLHVGAGTFQPVRTQQISDHKMHAERISVPATTVAKIQQAQARGGRIIAVGTTTMRSLETAAASGDIMPYQGETRLFITPGFQFHCVDMLLTNFHLPKSSLLMLVSAFGGYERMMAAYQQAVTEQYRFFSYGDAMLIEAQMSSKLI